MIQFRIAGLACALASLILISGPAALAQTPTPTATAPAQTDFTVAGVTFHMSLPEGYCFPFGRYVELARETAALDDRNMTDASFMKCDDMKKNVDPTSWGMLKTPLASIGKNVGTRAKLVAALGDRIKDPSVFQALNDPEKMINKRFQDIFGADANIKSSIQPVSVDTRTAYFAGTISASFSGTNVIAAAAAGVTIVKKTVFFYYLYSSYKEPKDIAALLPVVKSEMLRFMEQNDDLDAP